MDVVHLIAEHGVIVGSQMSDMSKHDLQFQGLNEPAHKIWVVITPISFKCSG